MYICFVARAPLLSTKSDLTCCTPIAEHSLSPEDADHLARLFTALADPIRLRMFSIIAASHEVCSCSLEEPLDKSQPTVSHHTRILADAGLIVGERRGRWTWWRAVPQRLEELARIVTP
jgi:ArsR family transcriptional regulator, arsenate/arsenite/antimonite-responsive transcriptional repressor